MRQVKSTVNDNYAAEQLRETGLCRWIDFDFNYLHRESMFGYDLFGLGNMLAYLASEGTSRFSS